MTETARGARWWRFDLHAHTPASPDYGKGPDQAELKQRTPHEWLADFMMAKLDCVAITDHNTGEWINPLKRAYDEMRRESPEGFRPLCLFPGVELTVGGGVHLLAIFDRDKSESEVDALLGAVGFPMDRKGTTDGVARQSVREAAATIRAHGALAIPAHADKARGLFSSSSGSALKGLLEDSNVTAIEVVDTSAPKPGVYRESALRITEVLGSDSHDPRGTEGKPLPGGRFTWVKMGEPSLDGLRLALLDGMGFSILRSDETDQDPNQEPTINIERIQIRNAHLMGRGDPAIAHFSPRLTGIIGGRGTGKSTLIEMLRLALRRDNDLHHDARSAFERFARVSSRSAGGALEKETEAVVTIWKGGSRYRICWRQDGAGLVIERESGERWIPEAGDVRTRFPVRILSQKEVLALAESPSGLLHHVDEAVETHQGWSEQNLRKLEADFKAKRSEARSLIERLRHRQRIEGQLADLERQMEVFQKAGHQDVLRDFQRQARQERIFNDWREGVDAAVASIRSVAEQIEPDDLPTGEFAPAKREPDASAIALLQAASDRRSQAVVSLAREAGALERFRTQWDREIAASEWAASRTAARSAYARLVARLEEAGVSDPGAYGALIQERRLVRDKLIQMDALQERHDRVHQQADEILHEIQRTRRARTQARSDFLRSVLGDSTHVRMDIIPYGLNPEAAEAAFRCAISREDGRLEAAILQNGEGELADLYAGLPKDPVERMNTLTDRTQRLKEKLSSWSTHGATERRRQHLINHLKSLTPDQLDDLLLWWPEDGVDVRYRRSNSGQFVPIYRGSPGQKSAAILAFLLSYGDRPIVLDQPEDDLDNSLIYDLIVRQLRDSKKRRQVIVVTHNANILVNGDAELVIRMDFIKGQCVINPQQTGCLQNPAVRRGVCNVMEGGLRAFENRYRRLKER